MPIEDRHTSGDALPHLEYRPGGRRAGPLARSEFCGVGVAGFTFACAAATTMAVALQAGAVAAACGVAVSLPLSTAAVVGAVAGIVRRRGEVRYGLVALLLTAATWVYFLCGRNSR